MQVFKLVSTAASMVHVLFGLAFLVVAQSYSGINRKICTDSECNSCGPWEYFGFNDCHVGPGDGIGIKEANCDATSYYGYWYPNADCSGLPRREVPIWWKQPLGTCNARTCEFTGKTWYEMTQCAQAPTTYEEIPNAELPSPYLPIGGCMDKYSATQKCATYYDDNTQKSCAGFFFVHDDTCSSDTQLFQFSDQFNPRPAELRANLQRSASLSTPTAVQLVFHIMPKHRMSLKDVTQQVVGSFLEPANTCENAEWCFAYQWQCDAQKCESHDGIYPSGSVTFSLYKGDVGTGADCLTSQQGYDVFVKQKQKRLTVNAPVSSETRSLVV